MGSPQGFKLAEPTVRDDMSCCRSSSVVFASFVQVK